MARSRIAAAVVLLVSCTAWVGREARAQEWTRYGHDSALTGRSPLAGRIETPQVSWTFAAGGRELLVDVDPAPGDHELVLDAATPVSAATSLGGPSSQLRPLDIDGTGARRPVAETFHERWAKVLPEVPGLQRVAWNHTWTDQPVCRLQLFAYDRGADDPRLVWETDPPEDTIFQPLNVVVDIDGDGTLEICVAAHYRVMIFEGTTGRKETELRYHGSRPYGWFGVADVNADGQMELVTIGDFQSHVDVLEYDPGRPEPDRLRVKWRRDIEQNIEERTKWPQIGPRPVVNVTGDARLEIVLNLFNDTGDNQWHVVVLDADTGHTLADLPRRFCWGSGNVDGTSATDTAAEHLFVTSTDGVLVHERGHCELLRIEPEGPRVIWSHPAAAWCTADWPRLGDTWSTTASQGMRHVLLQGEECPAFFIRTWPHEPERLVTLSALHGDSAGTVTQVWQLQGIPESSTVQRRGAEGTSGHAGVRVRVELPVHGVAHLSGHGALPRVVANRALGSDVPMPVVARLADTELPSVIVEAPGGDVCVLDPPAASSDLPRLRWQQRGRGMRDGSRTLGLVAADLDGDGACEILAADSAPAGHAVLRAYNGNGATVWERPFPQIPGSLPVWNVGALTFWWPGRFCSPERVDVLVNTRRGLMHSDIGQLLDGSDGTVLWQQDKAAIPGEFRWGWSGAPLAICDVLADERDELVCTHPVCYWIADGSTGELVTGRSLASRTALPAWAAYGEPMAVDFLGRGRPQILLDSPYILALLDLDGVPIWHGLPRIDYPVTAGEGNAGETTSCKHALLDIDGDGRWEIASAGYGDGVRLIDPANGQVLWRLPSLPPTCPRTAAANIDGRGGDESLYVADKRLVAITGDRESGAILWSWEAPARLSMPAIADVDGDGTAEIIVQDANAVVYCLDQQTP